MAAWPPTGAGRPGRLRVEMPVVDRGERLGSITVEMPAGHPLRPREQRLLADLADQAGMAFRNARLTAELSAQVEQLGQRTHELGRVPPTADQRRRRRTEPTRTGHRPAGDPAPRAAPRPTAPAVAVAEHHGPLSLDAAQLAPLVESLNTALEALREITRGVFPAQLARSGSAHGARLAARSDRSRWAA